MWKSPCSHQKCHQRHTEFSNCLRYTKTAFSGWKRVTTSRSYQNRHNTIRGNRDSAGSQCTTYHLSFTTIAWSKRNKEKRKNTVCTTHTQHTPNELLPEMRRVLLSKIKSSTKSSQPPNNQFSLLTMLGMRCCLCCLVSVYLPLISRTTHRPTTGSGSQESSRAGPWEPCDRPGTPA